MYPNCLDVVTSLVLRGYHGTFLFLDYLGGLNFEVMGVPAWVLWFSIIASHSDLVVFIKEYDHDFGLSQKSEIEFTPDRVQKKIVEIPHEELKWATKPESGKVDLWISPGGGNTKEEYERKEAEHAWPFLEAYADDGIPKDCLIVLDEEGEVATYPLGYPLYA